MAQQTAVEWLYERFLFAGYAAPSEWKEQAKQMEKGQIQDAWHDGNFLGRNGNLFVDYNTKEGYYKSEFENK